MSNPDDIVGHKTFRDGAGFRHEPLTRAEADAIHEVVEESRAKRIEAMPDVETAIRALTDAVHRLKELGWRDGQYVPKDGTMVELIEAGSSGIHRGYWQYHNGRNGHGCVWIPAHGDLYPSRPLLFRPITATDQQTTDREGQQE